MSTHSATGTKYQLTCLSLAICIAENLPVVIWGRPGEGKSSVISQIASDWNMHLETVIASIREPSDFAGLPYFENGMTRLAAPTWVHNVITAAAERRPSMVFYDELSTAVPAVQAALLRPILERVVGEVQLPASTRNVAAANPPGIAADGWEISPPMANRFTHLDWKLDAQTVKEGFTRGWPKFIAPVLLQGKERRANITRAKILVGVFLGAQPEMVSNLPKNFSGEGSNKAFKASNYAYPTPRAWESAARLYAAATGARTADGKPLPNEVIAILLEGTVGVSATKNFLTFARALDLPDSEALLANPASFKLPSRNDQLDVILSSVRHVYFANATEKRWSAWGDILAAVVEGGKGDIAYSYMKEWHSNRPTGVMPSNAQAKSFQKLLSELDPHQK